MRKHSELPNVIVMLVDDLGFGDLGISGHPTSQTPNIDRLAMNGKYFTQFYVTSPVCSPSRYLLILPRCHEYKNILLDIYLSVKGYF